MVRIWWYSTWVFECGGAACRLPEVERSECDSDYATARTHTRAARLPAVISLLGLVGGESTCVAVFVGVDRELAAKAFSIS